MTDTENNKNSNSPVSTSAPSLRFPGFTEPWRRIRLGKIATFSKGAGISKDQRNENGKPCILYGELYTTYTATNITNVISRTNLPEDSLIKSVANDVIIPSSGETAEDIATARCVLKNDVFLGGDLNIIRLNNDSGSFLCYQLNGVRKREIAKLAQGVSVVHLYKESLKSLVVSIPSIDEQSKIAYFLQLLDERIATQRRLIEDLEKLKSSIVEEVYCSPRENVPRQRINKKYVDNWSVCQLGDICTRITRRNTTIESNRILTIAAQYGLIDQCSFFNKVVASENLSNYYILKKGDFAYNKSYSGDYIWGAVKRLDKYESGVLSPLYICFQPKEKLIDSDYLLFYFESKKWHKDIAEIVVEGARNHGLLNVSIKDFFNMLIPLPSLDEQRDIAATIRAVLIKIECERTILQRYESQKGYLLSKMLI